MDWSALIFVALAIAWAAYLLPLALRHHDEDARSRTVDGFSHRMRVLARREPVDQRTARLVTPDGPPLATAPTRAEKKAARLERRAERRTAKQEVRAEREAAAAAAYAALTPVQVRARRAAAKRATRRRRNVLAVVLAVNVVVIALAAFAVIDWPFVAIPATLLVGWLVLCRVMVKGEQRGLVPARRPAEKPAADKPAAEKPAAEKPTEVPGEVASTEVEVSDEIDPMEDTSAGIAAVVDPAMWDPVPVTLPTYVTKPQAARRTVRTIDLDSTGVWTSGRTDADSQIAREADEAEKAAKARRDGDDQRATGS